MDYIQITAAQRQAMLKSMGASDIEDLLKQFPQSLRLKEPMDLPAGMDELSLQREMLRLAGKNTGSGGKVCFAGAGAYDHFIPTVVDALAGKGEFVTAYTPYQAEASQGALQAFFEFQTMVCRLAGMDIANASLYEGATALAEAVNMVAAASGKRHFLISGGVNPDYRRVLESYVSDLPIRLEVVDLCEGTSEATVYAEKITADTAGLVVQSPNYLGLLEDIASLAAKASQNGVSLIQVFNPISVGLLKRPGEQGADVAVAEGQPLGIPLSFGGPYLGLFAAKETFLGRMPGRLVGQTVDADGNRAFCLTLQTREQHIRREKATSNVCTNQGLMALRASVYLAAMGPEGLREVAQLCHNNAAYFAEQCRRRGVKMRFGDKPFFNEVLVELNDLPKTLSRASEAGMLAGVAIEGDYPSLHNCLLVAFTEKRTKQEIDKLVEVLG